MLWKEIGGVVELKSKTSLETHNTTNIPDSPFFPEHIGDLKASGITIGTANRARLRSVFEQELAELLDFSLPAGISGLLFPYGEDFFRIKLFPALVGEKGTMKYAQPKGSGVRLYVPPNTKSLLKNPTEALFVTEGEKKSLKADQEGIPCIGIGGLWNWVYDGQPIDDLDTIAWVERPVTIVPDSDIWTRQDLMKAVFALAVELENRGANVSVCIIPPEDDKKLGLDDFLVANCLDAFEALKRIPLTHKCFNSARKWHKEWVKNKRELEPPQEAIQLLEGIKKISHIRPAQDFVGALLWYGIPIDGRVILVNSERKLLKAEELPDNLVLDNRGFDLYRFSKEGIMRFLSGETQSGKSLVKELRTYFERYLIIRDCRVYLLLATWTMGTYVNRIFRVYPYLSLRSPTKECGKSRTEDLLSVVCFNATGRETSPTEATLFRGPSKNGGTVLLDEVEGLRNDRDRFGNLLSILNSGFERGGSVTRLEQRGKRFVDVSYPTYCPRVLAGINRLADTLEGRAITIFMERKLRSEKVERFSRAKVFDALQTTRDKLYIWALTHAAELAQVYDVIDRFSALEDLGDRERDLWEPLASITLLCDSENGEERPLTDELCQLAYHLSDIRSETDTASVIQVLDTLEEILAGKPEMKITPTELLKRLKENPYFDYLKSAKRLASLLAPLGLIPNKSRDRETQKVIRTYKIKAVDIEDSKKRYGSSE